MKNKSDIENNLVNAFESGYSNAANSLAQLTKNKIGFRKSDNGFHSLESDFFSVGNEIIARGNHRIIITEIFGDVTGKSYLFLSESDYNLFSAGIPESKDPSINLKEEFLKELDNILSASVITRLSNELHLKMYGNVPTLLEKVTARISDIIYDDFIDESEEVYIDTTFFVVDNNNHVCPFFVWVLDSKTLAKTA
ncbi:hypothetical protein [Chryseolinea sp. H1M3-3]|uniref:hypothetical protein n=1 Tax=Chryseolinea sp. H1M3-3 TaxID=3034144 RepID=UPI0023EBE602|nr:hypothetical protein [Chryseolinea sp. H1M3-3]